MPQAAPERQTTDTATPLATPWHALPLIGGGFLLLAAFLLQALPLWLLRVDQGRAWFDEAFFHSPVIRQFLDQWPAPVLADYRSATTPGFHLVMAWLARSVGADPHVLRPIAAIFTALMLLMAYAVVMPSRRGSGPGGPWWAALLTLPLACSMYVVLPGVWLAPDNLGWLLVLALLFVCLRALDRGVLGIQNLLAAAVPACVLLFLLVNVRQSHLWAWTMLLATAWLTASPIAGSGPAALLSNPRRRSGALLVALIAGAPAAYALFEYHSLWGGLVPPRFQAQHASGINPAAPALALSLIGMYSVFFAAWLRPGLGRLWRESRPVLVVAALVGAALALGPATTYLYEPRSSGLWNLAKIEQRLGVSLLGHTSPSILILSTLGAVCLAGWLARLEPARRWFFLATLVGFELAQAANANAWQRYQEPLLLVLIAALALAAGNPDDGLDVPRSRWHQPLNVWRVIGPLALCGVFLMLSVQGISSAGAEARLDSYRRGQQPWPTDVPPPPGVAPIKPSAR